MSYNIFEVTETAVRIVDNGQGMSITNSAETVVEQLYFRYGGDKKIIYMDTEGIWSELVHDGHGNFLDFGDTD